MNDFKRRTQNGDARFFGSGGATFASRTTGELEAFFMNIGGTEGTDFALAEGRSITVFNMLASLVICWCWLLPAGI
jgi:hypothetical protein